MSVSETCRRVQSFLKSKFQVSNVPVTWIEGCVNCYRNRHSNSNFEALLEFVRSQWLLADFKKLQIRSLPPNLSSVPVVTLSENYLLQITYILNIGVSAYSQYQKIKKGQEDNSEVSAEVKIQSKWEPKGQRMLMLHVTDGFQDVQLMEYVPIPQLNLDIVPGCKILIKGPVECRKGVMLLHPKNVELMGGEVQELVDANAPENVLARIIGRQENPTPVYGSYTRDTQADKIVETTLDSDIGASRKPIMMKASQPIAPPAKTTVGGKRILEHQPSPPAKKLQPDAHTDLFPDDDEDIFLLDDDFEMAMENDPQPPAVSQTSSTSSSSPAVAKTRPIRRPFSYLRCHLRNTSGAHPQPVCIKGFVSTIRTKLSIADGEWRLGAKINDGSAALDVDFSHQVLEQMIGYSPNALKTLKASGPDGNRKASLALENVKQSLIRLNCLLHLEWPPSGSPSASSAVVVRLEEIRQQHLAAVLGDDVSS